VSTDDERADVDSTGDIVAEAEAVAIVLDPVSVVSVVFVVSVLEVRGRVTMAMVSPLASTWIC
jgi:hypothetical protein